MSSDCMEKGGEDLGSVPLSGCFRSSYGAYP